jgi:hypothetical protein
MQWLTTEPGIWDGSNISKYGGVQRNTKTSSEWNSTEDGDQPEHEERWGLWNNEVRWIRYGSPSGSTRIRTTAIYNWSFEER